MGDDFDDWLAVRLKESEADEVFGPYIRTILEGDESAEDKSASLEDMLAGLGLENVEDFKEKVRILVLHWDSLMLAPYISVKCNTVGIKMFKELLELKMFGIRNAAFDVQNVHSPTSCTPLTHKTFALLTYLHKWMREKISCKLPLAYDPVDFLIQKCIVYVDKNIIKAI